MIKYILTLLFLLVLVSQQKAQDIQVNWGEIYKLKSEEGKTYFSKRVIGSTKDYFYVAATTRKKQFILQFNYDNQLIKSIPVVVEIDGKKVYVSNIVNTSKNDYFILESKKNKKEKNVYAAKLKSDPLFPSDLKYLFTHKSIKGMGFEINYDIGGISISPDSSKVLFSYLKSNAELMKKKEAVTIAVLDEEMKVIWTNETTFPYPDHKIDLQGMSISNEGKVYSLTYIKSKEKKGTKFIKKGLTLYEVKKESLNEIKALDVENHKLLTNAFIFFDNDNGVNIIGSFTKKKLKGNDKKEGGLFMVKLNTKHEKVFLKTYPWGEAVSKNFKGNIENFKFNHGNSPFYVQSQVHIDSKKKTIIIFAENRYKIENKEKDAMRKIAQFGSGSIIASKLSFDGELNWMTLIKKEFSSDWHTPVSFIYGQKDDDIYLIFNDFKNRKEKKDLNAPKSPLLIYYFTDITKLNKDGEITLRQTLFNSKDLKFYLNVNDSKFIRNGLILIAGEGIKNLKPRYRFGSIILP